MGLGKSISKAAAPVLSTAISQAETLVKKEKEAFLLEKAKCTVPTPAQLTADESVVKAPWDDMPSAEQEHLLRKQVLLLSKESWNFLSPLENQSASGSKDSGSGTTFSTEAYVGMAKACLVADPNLAKMRFDLVPHKISEEAFWKNYFSRVHFLRESVLSLSPEFLPAILIQQPAINVILPPAQSSPATPSSATISASLQKEKTPPAQPNAKAIQAPPKASTRPAFSIDADDDLDAEIARYSSAIEQAERENIKKTQPTPATSTTTAVSLDFAPPAAASSTTDGWGSLEIESDTDLLKAMEEELRQASEAEKQNHELKKV